MGPRLQSLLVFVLLLLVLNFALGELDYGMHISVVGSVVLTLVISALLGRRGP
jgi:hypothetical protein